MPLITTRDAIDGGVQADVDATIQSLTRRVGWVALYIGRHLLMPIAVALTMISRSLNAMSPVNPLLGGSAPGEQNEDH